MRAVGNRVMVELPEPLELRSTRRNARGFIRPPTRLGAARQTLRMVRGGRGFMRVSRPLGSLSAGKPNVTGMTTAKFATAAGSEATIGALHSTSHEAVAVPAHKVHSPAMASAVSASAAMAMAMPVLATTCDTVPAAKTTARTKTERRIRCDMTPADISFPTLRTRDIASLGQIHVIPRSRRVSPRPCRRSAQQVSGPRRW